MRPMSWVGMVLLIGSAGGAALADELNPAAPGCRPRIAAFCGPACSTPPGFTLMAPGCVCPCAACDNAWNCFCQHSAHWKAKLARVGTRGCCEGGSAGPACPCLENGSQAGPYPPMAAPTGLQPIPKLPVAPEPPVTPLPPLTPGPNP